MKQITFIQTLEESTLEELEDRLQVKINRFKNKYDLEDIKFSTHANNNEHESEWYCAIMLFADKTSVD